MNKRQRKKQAKKQAKNIKIIGLRSFMNDKEEFVIECLFEAKMEPQYSCRILGNNSLGGSEKSFKTTTQPK